MNKAEKEAVTAEVETKLKEATTVVVTDYRGLKVHELAELRRELRQQNIEYTIYKNTLVKRAVDKINLSDLNEYLAGPTALAFGFDDPIVPARLLSVFGRKNAALAIKGGLLEGRVLDAGAMKAVAALPSKEVLLAKLVGLMQSPIAGLASVLNAPLRGLAVALSQVAEQKK